MRLRLTKRLSVVSVMALVAVVANAFGCIVKPFRDQNRAAAELIGRGYDLRMEPSWLSQFTRQRSFDRVVMASQSPKTGPITAADVQGMNTLPYLEAPTLDGATDDQLLLLRRLTRLQTLRIWTGDCTEPGLIRLLENLTELRSLDIRFTSDPPLVLSDAGLATLANLPRFRNLYFDALHDVSDAGLAHLEGMTGFDDLDLSDMSITDAGLSHLSGFRSLHSLWLQSDPITDAGLGHLPGLNGLQDLSLNQTRISDDGLAHLKGLPMTRLDLGWTDVSDAGLVDLRGMKTLVYLQLARTRVTDAGLVYLKGLLRP
jgi:hypothetical protein